MKKSKTKKMSPVAVTIIVISTIILLVAASLGALLWRKYHTINKDSEQAQQLYNPTGTVSSGDDDGVEKDVAIGEDPNADIVGGDTPSKETNPTTGIVEDFNQLYEINTDIKGWIKIPNTGLNQPVVQSSDNSYYLYRNIYKKKSALGIPFMDYRAVVSKEHMSSNITIYGHAAANGTHFAPVKKYKDVEYYKKHPTLNFNTIYGDSVYKIVGFFMEDVGSDNAKMFNYHDKVELDQAGFDEFIKEMNKRSYFKTGVDVKYGDQLVTLSTCDEDVVKGTSTPFRVALVARKLRDGESAKVDPSQATINKEMVMPDKWVAAKGKENPYK